MLDILLVEDSESDAELIGRALSRSDVACSLRRARDRNSFIEQLAAGRPNLIICDHNLPQFDGREALELACADADPPPFILVTGSLDEETAVEYMKSGAADYILKDRLVRLGAAVHRALERDLDRRARAQAIAARLETEQRLNLLVRATNDAIWDLDVHKGTLEVNEGFRTLIGRAITRQPLTLEVWHQRIHPADRERVEFGLRSVLLSRATYWTDDYRLRLADDTYAQVLDRGYILRDDDGRALRMVGALVDVTERQRLKEQLQQAQKMEAIGRLAGGIAHDFNNVLTSILISTDLLLNGEDSEQARRHDLEEVRAAAERAANLTRQLLAFSRKQVISLQRIDLNHVVSRFSGMLRRLIGESVQLNLRLAGRVGAVRADAGQMEQILLNLAVNARDAMPSGGSLTIATADVELDGEYCREHADLAPGPYVRLAVSDTGSGMDAETRERIFEPFFTTKEVGKGTGLGLATVYGIVRQHGGDIAVSSQPNGGTTFHIHLPRVDGPPDVQTVPASSPVALEGDETILLVEDEDRVRDLTRRILERRGYAVLPARDSSEAMEIAEKYAGRIDMIITDVMLPGASGPAFTRRVAERGFRGPVLFLSGYSEDAVVHHGKLQPDALFLGKPFSADALATMVRRALDGRLSSEQ